MFRKAEMKDQFLVVNGLKLKKEMKSEKSGMY
jgi:hypothetical protein